MHIYMPLIILIKLTSSHSTPFTHLISLNSSHLCSYIHFFIFIYPSPICFFIKLLTCGVIRSYNWVMICGIGQSVPFSHSFLQIQRALPKEKNQPLCLAVVPGYDPQSSRRFSLAGCCWLIFLKWHSCNPFELQPLEDIAYINIL